MNNENKKAEAVFPPCGNSMEKMDEIRADALEQVSGGANTYLSPLTMEEAQKLRQSGGANTMAIPNHES